MAVPNSRSTCIEWCLRRLGKPVINIEVSDDQCQDRLDEALQRYAYYHFDGTEKIYYKHQVTQTDIDNQYITVPQTVNGIVKMFNYSAINSGMNIFDIRYQIALNDLYTLTNQSMIPYVMTMQNLQFLEDILVGQQSLRFNQHQSKLYVDTDWRRFPVGTWLIFEAYQDLDPETYTGVYNDIWLKRYLCALIKLQWSSNTSKYAQIQLPGGVVFNALELKEEAREEIEDLEREMLNDNSLPVAFIMG